jgi:hypothetical protein
MDPNCEKQERWWALYDAAIAAGYEIAEPSDEGPMLMDREIEITPEMIAAGVTALASRYFDLV